MIDKIKQLKEEGKTYREIADILNVSKGKVEWELNKTEQQDSTRQQDNNNKTEETIGQLQEIDNKTEDISKGSFNQDLLHYCPYGYDPSKCSLNKETNNSGIKKLRLCDYSKNEQKNKQMPVFDCINIGESKQ